jgi:hypothetical protein
MKKLVEQQKDPSFSDLEVARRIRNIACVYNVVKQHLLLIKIGGGA